MSESKWLMRPLLGAAAVFWGVSAGGPAWATYGGGACHGCAPAPVVATTQRDPAASLIGKGDQRAPERRESDHGRADVRLVRVAAIHDRMRGQANEHAQDDQQWYRSSGHLRR